MAPAPKLLARKTVRLQDGTELTGNVQATNDGIMVTTQFGTCELHIDDVQAVKMGVINAGFAAQESGDSVITLKNGRKYRANVVEKDNGTIIDMGAIQLPIAKEDLLIVDKIVHPLATWVPPEDHWYWITLRDGTRVCTKVVKNGAEYTLSFRYGTITAKADDILVVHTVSIRSDPSVITSGVK
jgi:hypothetical protein